MRQVCASFRSNGQNFISIQGSPQDRRPGHKEQVALRLLPLPEERQNRTLRFRPSRAPRPVAARDALFPLPEGETSELVCKHILKKISTHLFSRGSRQSGVKIAGTSFQTGDVFGVIIPSTVLPATTHDPLPLEGQRTDRRMMTLAPLDLHPVVAKRPGTTRQGALGHFVKSLAQEFRAGPAHVDPERFAAGLLD